jgi:hypothetical protein
LVPVSPGVSAGDTVVIAITAQTGGAPQFNCSDTKGNTYTTDRRYQAAAGRPTVALCHAYITTALTTADLIKVAAGNASGTCRYNIHALEFSNIRDVSPVAATSGAGWTNLFDIVNTALEGVTEYLITSASPQSAVSSNNGAKQWAAAVVAYRPAPTP